MDVYAAFARSHMRRFGTTQRQMAAVAAKNHAHSVAQPAVAVPHGYTIDEVLAAPPITYPLTLPMCSPISRRRGRGDRVQRRGAEAAEPRPRGARSACWPRWCRAARTAVTTSYEQHCTRAGRRSAPTRSPVSDPDDVGGRGARRHRDGRDHPDREPGLLRASAKAARSPSAATRASAAASRSTRRAGWSPRATRSVRPASARSTNWSHSCAARRAPDRSKARASHWPRTAAGCTASRKPPPAHDPVALTREGNRP